MGKFKADRFNGFIKSGLVKGLYEDLRKFLLHNERDVHAAAYAYTRKFLGRKGRDRLILRCDGASKGQAARGPGQI